MADGTVKKRTSTILSKLGVRDRTRAVLRALAAPAVKLFKWRLRPDAKLDQCRAAQKRR